MFLFNDDIFEAMRSNLFQEKYLSLNEKDLAAKRINESNYNLFISKSYENKNELLIQPRGGVGPVEKHKSLIRNLAKAGAHVLPCTIDSHTRLNDFETLEEVFKAKKNKKQFLEQLNGFPLIHHGHDALYEEHQRVGLPVSLRHGSPDPRILCEVALMSGIYEIEGGGICYNLPYSRDYPIGLALRNWAYVDKLCAFLSTEDKPISREGFGPLTATLVPPFMVIIVQALEMLMALDKGVKCFSLSFGQMGNLQQDFITAAAMRKVASYFVNRLKQNSQPRINLVYHQWMGAFPVNTEHAQALISLGTISAKLCRANKIVIKTVAEAHSIPDEKTNMQAVQLVDFLIKHSGVLPDFNSPEVKEEIEILVEQVIFVLNKILNLDEILEVSVIKAIELGFIDIPFAPHQKNAGLLWCARDKQKNIRVVDFGNIPTIKEFKMFETQRVGVNQKSNSIAAILDDINIMI